MQKQTKRVTENEETKKKNMQSKKKENSPLRTKQNGGNQTLRYRIQNNGYMMHKELTDNYKKLSENYISMKK